MKNVFEAYPDVDTVYEVDGMPFLKQEEAEGHERTTGKKMVVHRRGDAKKGEAKDGDAKKGETKDGGAKKGEAKEADAKKGDAKDGDAKKGDAKDGDAKKGE